MLWTTIYNFFLKICLFLRACWEPEMLHFCCIFCQSIDETLVLKKIQMNWMGCKPQPSPSENKNCHENSLINRLQHRQFFTCRSNVCKMEWCCSWRNVMEKTTVLCVPHLNNLPSVNNKYNWYMIGGWQTQSKIGNYIIIQNLRDASRKFWALMKMGSHNSYFDRCLKFTRRVS